MTDRMALLERVAEAAREWHAWETDHSKSMVDRNMLWGEIGDALAALDALPAEPVGETVEAWGYVRTDPKGFVGGHIGLSEQHARRHAGEWGRTENGPIMGTVFSVRAPLPTIPTVAAKVET